jgi:hypothetical protein
LLVFLISNEISTHYDADRSRLDSRLLKTFLEVERLAHFWVMLRELSMIACKRPACEQGSRLCVPRAFTSAFKG